MLIQKKMNPYSNTDSGMRKGLEDAFLIDWKGLNYDSLQTFADALDSKGFDLVHYLSQDDNYVLQIVPRKK
jgi:hypothetical protein